MNCIADLIIIFYVLSRRTNKQYSPNITYSPIARSMNMQIVPIQSYELNFIAVICTKLCIM